MKEIFAQAHAETIRGMPFNSLGKIIIAEGGTYPETYGGNCVMQARRATRIALMRGLSPSAISYGCGEQRPHWVVFAEDDGIHKGDLLMSDPYYMTSEPIDVTQVLNTGRVIQPAYPHIGRHHSVVESVATGPQSIDVHLWALRVNAGPNGDEADLSAGHKKVHTYSYDLTRRTSELPPDNYQLLAGLTQKNLEMGVLREDNGVTRVYLEPQNGAYNMLQVGQRKLARARQMEAFDAEMERIALELQTTAEQLWAFFTRGREAYLRRRPTDDIVGVGGSGWKGQSELLGDGSGA